MDNLQKKRRGPRSAQGTELNAGTGPVPLADITLPYSSRNDNINRWNAVKGQLKVRNASEPIFTPVPAKPVHLQFAPVQADRDFRVVAIRQSKHRDGTTSWLGSVADRSRPALQPIALFEDSSIQGSALKDRFCATEADARRVFEYACALINRTLPDISDEGDGKAILAKRMIETLAICAISPQFDFGLVDASLRTRSGPYSWKHPVARFTDKAFQFNVTTGAGVLQRVNISTDYIDWEKLKSLVGSEDAAPDWFYFKMQDKLTGKSKYAHKADALSPEQQVSLRELVRYVQYRCWGYIGSPNAMSWYQGLLIEPYRKSTGQPRTVPGGPCGGQIGWKTERQGRSIRIIPSRVVAAAVIGGSLPAITVFNETDVAAAYVQQRMYLALEKGWGILNMWQAGCLAADVVSFHRPALIDDETMLYSQCECETDVERHQRAHHCMFDFYLRPCIELTVLADGRLICENCLVDASIAEKGWVRVPQLHRLITQAVKQAANKDKRLGGPGSRHKMRASLRAELMKYVSTTDANEWFDAYGGTRSLKDAIYEVVDVEASGRRIKHPLLFTIDAVRPAILVEGQTFYHHPDNIVATTHAANLLKGTSPAIILPILSLARKQCVKEIQGQPQDAHFWRGLNNALDHVFLISQLVPRRRAARLQLKISQSDFDALNKMWMTGRFTGTVLLRGFATRAVQYQKAHRFTQWTPDDHERLSNLHCSIKESSYNVDGLAAPCAEDGAPWLWRRDHQLQDWTWARLFDEFAERYRSMDEFCDPDNEHEETPDTMFLTFLIQWYETGGRDGVFGFELVLYSKHPSSMSVGRSASVDPKSHMRTGWTCLQPSQLSEYNPRLKSIVYQSWSTNELWYNYPKVVLPTLPEIVLDEVPLSTKWYNKPLLTLNQIRFPRTFQDFQGEQTIAAKLSAAAPDPGRDDDPEATRYAEREEDEHAMETITVQNVDSHVPGTTTSSLKAATTSTRDGDTGHEDSVSVAAQVEFPSSRVHINDTAPSTYQLERQYFQQKFDSGDRRFSGPMLRLLDHAGQQARETKDDEDKALVIMLNDIYLSSIIPLGKIASDGDAAWIDDHVVDLVVGTLAAKEHRAPDTVYLSGTTYVWLSLIDQGFTFERMNEFGMELPLATAPHGTRKVAMAYNLQTEAHWVAIAIIFDEANNKGRIQYWNSSVHADPTKTGHYRRSRHILPMFGRWLAESPAVDLPHLDWSAEIEIMPQTQQNDPINCGVLATNAVVRILQGTAPEVRTGADAAIFSEEKRYEYLCLAYRHIMNEDLKDEDYEREKRQRLESNGQHDTMGQETGNDKNRSQDQDNRVEAAIGRKDYRQDQCIEETVSGNHDRQDRNQGTGDNADGSARQGQGIGQQDQNKSPHETAGDQEEDHGLTLISTAAIQQLNRRIDDLTADNRALRDEIAGLKHERQERESFCEALESELRARRQKGKSLRVVLRETIQTMLTAVDESSEKEDNDQEE
ncbi:Beige 1 [Sphaceloma murrayae]|uniref:Beige 1 n=1 Tax=Sphaceloma murrayae TaxID=2082308 RepID=A0A2K1QIU0_9PEZI|nr:Beige 1 [Sphaceloma murrayae]